MILEAFAPIIVVEWMIIVGTESTLATQGQTWPACPLAGSARRSPMARPTLLQGFSRTAGSRAEPTQSDGLCSQRAR
jgi:hypothetical protein